MAWLGRGSTPVGSAAWGQLVGSSAGSCRLGLPPHVRCPTFLLTGAASVREQHSGWAHAGECRLGAGGRQTSTGALSALPSFLLSLPQLYCCSFLFHCSVPAGPQRQHVGAAGHSVAHHRYAACAAPCRTSQLACPSLTATAQTPVYPGPRTLSHAPGALLIVGCSDIAATWVVMAANMPTFYLGRWT